jgi:hypothetical protein
VEKAERAEKRLEKRKKEWEGNGKEGEYTGLNRKERRRLELEKKNEIKG